MKRKNIRCSCWASAAGLFCFWFVKHRRCIEIKKIESMRPSLLTWCNIFDGLCSCLYIEIEIKENGAQMQCHQRFVLLFVSNVVLCCFWFVKHCRCIEMQKKTGCRYPDLFNWFSASKGLFSVRFLTSCRNIKMK